MTKQNMNYNFSNKKKQLALLIDPDRITSVKLTDLCIRAQSCMVDIILVGGSLLTNDLESCITNIKQNCSIPVYIFPGSATQISFNADGIFFLSLISGRNPEFLIGNHVIAAPKLKQSGLDIVSVGYVLIDGGKQTSVEYISNTRPIPYEKDEIAVATALAGEYLGLKVIYLEGGSGASQAVSPRMISAVRSALSIPLIVGGGIRNTTALKNALDAGADIIVVGTAIEENDSLLEDFAEVVRNY